jgi:hypothetical protein
MAIAAHYSNISRGEDVSAVKPPYDVIIASECLYYEEIAEPLYKTLCGLSDQHTEIFVSYESHNPEGVELFFQYAQQAFDIIQVKDRLASPHSCN